MDEKLLIVSDKESDLLLLEDILRSKGFTVHISLIKNTIEEVIKKDTYSVIIADLDFVDDEIYNWLSYLQEKSTGSFLIAYGENADTDHVSDILQKGAYGFISRSRLPQRIYDTIADGLKNRNAFFEIVDMMDELIAANKKLVQEREALGSRNEALAFIHRLSNEVAYDFRWNKIIQRILDAGLPSVIDTQFITLLYRIGTGWNLDLYLAEENVDRQAVKASKEEIIERFFSLSGLNLSEDAITTHLYPSGRKTEKDLLPSISEHLVLLLKSAETPLGMLTLLPSNKETIDPLKKELLSTISTILTMSLNNAKEYQNLRSMTTRDELTGLLNQKGFMDYMVREFEKTRRFKKSLSLIMFDIDSLKRINDSLGHQAGDYILKELANCLVKPLRKTDIVCRYGGNQFAVILPETEIEKAEILIKRLLSVIRDHIFLWKSKRIKVQVSFGISATDELMPEENGEDMVLRAKDRCYIAKRSENILYSQAI